MLGDAASSRTRAAESSGTRPTARSSAPDAPDDLGGAGRARSAVDQPVHERIDGRHAPQGISSGCPSGPCAGCAGPQFRGALQAAPAGCAGTSAPGALRAVGRLRRTSVTRAGFCNGMRPACPAGICMPGGMPPIIDGPPLPASGAPASLALLELHGLREGPVGGVLREIVEDRRVAVLLDVARGARRDLADLEDVLAGVVPSG